jgi:hypothetical protein
VPPLAEIRAARAGTPSSRTAAPDGTRTNVAVQPASELILIHQTTSTVDYSRSGLELLMGAMDFLANPVRCTF